ncbi:MAG: 6-hydroxymethylpterin diphosphokinase MptE-like protein [Hyphomicrobiaceae bacterium]
MQPDLVPLAGALTFDQTFEVDACVASNQRQVNSSSCYERGLPGVAYEKPKGIPLAIVASGPSAKDYLDRFRKWRGEVWAINGAFGWLLSEGIKPHAFIGMDPEPFLVDYLKETPDCTYYIANQCDAAVFDHLNDRKVVTWHVMDPTVQIPIGQVPIRGGSTCLGRAPMVGCLLGFTDIHLYGGDSSFVGDTGYAYGGAPREGACFAELKKKKYTTTRQMLVQAYEIAEMIKDFPGSITIHGSGLLPDLAKANLRGFKRRLKYERRLVA